MNINFETTRYRGIVDMQSGDILTYSKSVQHYKKELNVGDKISSFPYTDEDFIIIEARRMFAEHKNN